MKKYSEARPKNQPASHYYVLCILADAINHHKKHYCYPSYKYILKVLRQRYGYVIKRRMLVNIINFLAESGQIVRVKRHCKNAQGELSLHSNLYMIYKRGWKLLKRFRRMIANTPWKKRAKDLLERWQPAERRAGNQKFTAMGPIVDQTMQKLSFDPGG